LILKLLNTRLQDLTPVILEWIDDTRESLDSVFEAIAEGEKL